MLYFAGKGEERFKKSWSGVEWGGVEFSEFPNGEQRVRVLSSVENELCVVVQGMAEEPDKAWIRAMLLADALKENGAKGVKLVVPFLSYALMNRHFDQEPISVRVVGKTLSQFFDEVEVWEVHEEEVAEFFTVPFYNLPILWEMAKEIQNSKFKMQSYSSKLKIENWKMKNVDVVVAPDKGSVVRARQVAREWGVELILGQKERDVVSTEIKDLKVEGEVKGKRVVIVDDLVNTGGTIVKTAGLLRKQGTKEVGLMVAHWLPVRGNWERVEKAVDWVVISNSVKVDFESEKLRVVEVGVGAGYR